MNRILANCLFTSIPYLKFDAFTFEFESFDEKIDSDGRRLANRENALTKSPHETRFAHTSFAD